MNETSGMQESRSSIYDRVPSLINFFVLCWEASPTLLVPKTFAGLSIPSTPHTSIPPAFPPSVNMYLILLPGDSVLS